MVIIDQETCIGCGKCAADCPAWNIKIEEKAAIKADCIQCGHCVAVCPAGAVSIPEYDMEDIEEYQEEGCSRNRSCTASNTGAVSGSISQKKSAGVIWNFWYRQDAILPQQKTARAMALSSCKRNWNS